MKTRMSAGKDVGVCDKDVDECCKVGDEPVKDWNRWYKDVEDNIGVGLH